MRARGIILARQSRTRDRSESLPAQVESGRATAERFDIDVVAEFVEPPSTSGSKDRGRSRHHFRQVVEMIAGGLADCVIVYKTDRLTRGGGIGWAPVIDAAELAGLDLDRLVLTPSGWMSEFEIGIRATMDREEAKKLSDRSRLVHERLARDGRYGGNGSRPFGFEGDGTTHRPDEADLIREAADRKRGGETWHAIAVDWRDRGIVGPGGNPFRPENLARVVRSDRVAGYRTHNGKRVKAAWKPILEHGATGIDRGAAATWTRTYLLSGIARCGKCLSKMRGGRTPNGRVTYRCPPPIDGGCSGTSIQGADLDREVVLLLADHLDHELVAKAARRRRTRPASDDLDTQIADDQAALEQLARDHYADRIIGRGEYIAARQAVEARLTALQRRQATQQRAARAQHWIGHGDELLAVWDDKTLAEQRDILLTYIASVTIGPAVRGLNHFDRDRLLPERGGGIGWRR